MKFLFSILVYLAMALVLGVGILKAVQGNYWVLIGGVAGYALMLGLIGCLPSKSHH